MVIVGPAPGTASGRPRATRRSPALGRSHFRASRGAASPYVSAMTTFSRQERLQVVSLLRRPEGADHVLLGNPLTNVYLVAPVEVAEILDLLAAGHTIGEVADHLAARHGQQPDLDDLLTVLMGKGLVSPQVSGAPTTAAKSPHPLRYHFSSFPLGLARAIFSRPVLAAAALVIMSAALAALRRPAVIPNWRALVFDRHVPAMVLAMIAANFLITSLHEIAHLIAARARGVPSRFGLGHRLWVLVAETDLSGLWALPASERYLPLVAGALLDLVSASTLVLVLFVWQAGILALSLPAGRVLSALLYIYMLRLLWQLFFFVRTDLYYVLATGWTGTERRDSHLPQRYVVAPWLDPQADQSQIPRQEPRSSTPTPGSGWPGGAARCSSCP